MGIHIRDFVAVVGFVGVLSAGPVFAGQNLPIEAFLEQERVTGRLPGLAAVVVDGAGFQWETGLGWAEIDVRPVAPDTPFLVASVSKPVTATAVMAAVDDGLLSLDEDIRGAFHFSVTHPFFPDAPLTARQLLAHASSIVDDPSRLQAAIAPGDPVVPLEAFLAGYFAPGELRSWSSQPPESAFAYSNVGFALAGHLLERRTGEPFSAFVARRLFAPLGMTDSAWTLGELPRPAALPYRTTAGGFSALTPYGAPYAPAVLLRTSARDLGRYLAFHLARGQVAEQQVVSAEAIAEMERLQFPLSGLQGLGWRYLTAGGRLVLGHGGSGSGVTAEIVIDRARGRGVALLTNVDATQGAAARAFQAILDRLLTETEFPSPEEPPPAPRTWLLPSAIRGHRGGPVEYRTDLWLVNPNAMELTFTAAFQPRGAGDGPSPVTMTLAPGEGRVVTDVLLSSFGLSVGQGTLALTVSPGEESTPALSALVRVGEVGGPSPTSQWSAAEEITGVVGERWLAGVHQGDGFEATVSVVNAEPSSQTIRLEAWDANGVALAPASGGALDLVRGGVRTLRLDALFPVVAQGGGPFTLRFRGPGRFLAGATLIESGSGDSLYLPAGEPGPELGTVLVPRAVRGRGQRGAMLSTELALHNPSDAEISVRLELWRRGRENPNPESVAVAIPPRAIRVYHDVLGELFPSAGADAAGALVISSAGEGARPVATALTLVRTADGRRLGTPVPVRAAGGAAEQSVFGAGWGAGRDSSVGLVNQGATTAVVELFLIDDSGQELGRRTVGLGLHQHLERTLPGLFGALPPGRGWTVVAQPATSSSDPGAVSLYLSSLDETGDPDLLTAVSSPRRP